VPRLLAAVGCPVGKPCIALAAERLNFFYTWRGIRVCGCGLCRRAGCELPDGVRTTQAPSRRASWRARLLSSGLWSPGGAAAAAASAAM